MASPRDGRGCRGRSGNCCAYAAGMTLEAAARRTGIRPSTAKHYLERIKQKYRSAGRPTYTKLDLAARVREDGLLR